MLPLVRGKIVDGKTILACPRPLSRKALRGLMSHRHRELTGEALSARYHRIPGGGCARRRLAQQFDELEEKLRIHGPSAFDKTTAEMFSILSRMFRGGGGQKQKAQKVRAAGRKQ
jgi:hypothetical protein